MKTNITFVRTFIFLSLIVLSPLSFGKYSAEEILAFSANLNSKIERYKDTIEGRLKYHISSRTVPQVKSNVTTNLVLAAALSSISEHSVKRLIMNRIGRNQSYANYLYKVQTDKIYLSSKDKKEFEKLFIILCLVASIEDNLQDFLDEVYLLEALRELNLYSN